MNVSIVIVNYNTAAMVEACLNSLESEPVTRVLVVDNFHSGRAVHDIRELVGRHPGVELLEIDANIGFGGAVNRGVASLSEYDDELIWVLNPDVRVEAGCVAELVDVMSRGESDILSPVITTGNQTSPTIWFAGGDFDEPYMRTRHRLLGQPERKLPRLSESTFITGAAMMMSRQTWDRLGGFDESLFLYWEDAELCIRATRLGLKMSTAGRARVWHEVGGSDSSEGTSRHYYFHMQRNRFHVASSASLSSRLILGRGAVETISLLWRPWREPSDRWGKFVASCRGLVSGLGFVRELRTSRNANARIGIDAAAQPTRARFYKSLRSAHLERSQMADSVPVWTLYQEANYDLEPGLLQQDIFVRRMRPFAVPGFLKKHKIDVLELNEPAMARAWPELVLIVFLLKVLRLAPRVQLTSYAIENFHPAEVLSSTMKIPYWLSRGISFVVMRFLTKRLDRVAFGSRQSETLYREILRGRLPEHKFFSSLPKRKNVPIGNREKRIVFLGSFEERKGILKLLAAWNRASNRRHDASLQILGKGPLEGHVTDWAQTRPEVEVVTDPSRRRIEEVLSKSKVLVLPSQPTSKWREQLGLPILEGLSHGCLIVCTEETGLAPELSTLGHWVLASDASDEKLAEALLEALESPVSPAEVVQQLPEIDGRLAADIWMNSEGTR